MGLTERLQSALKFLLNIRQNPAGGAIVSRTTDRVGQLFTPPSYGDYYVRSVPVYAAIKLRASAISRVPLIAYRTDSTGQTRDRLPSDHPLQSLLDRVNPFWTRGDLWAATETYTGLWGKAFWAINRGTGGIPVEIWPLRPDRMRIIPSADKYVKGFVYEERGRQIPFLPEDIVWMREFNPVNEYDGLAPIAPLRLSLDMGIDALWSNRRTISNDQTPGMIFTDPGRMTQPEVEDFYERWEQRYKGPQNRMRPAIVSDGMKAEHLGFSPKDMEYVASMRWTVEDVARVYNVPKAMLHDLERATYANIETQRRVFWEDCIVPRLFWYQERLQEFLVPMFNDPLLVTEFDTSKVEALQEDEDKKATRRKIYLDTGTLTINEVREEMGREPVPWGEEPRTPAAPPAFGSAEGDDDDEPRGARTRRLTLDHARLERQFLDTLNPLERDFHRLMARLFDEQIDSMLKKLIETRSAHPAWKERVLVGALTALGSGANGRVDPIPTASTGGLEIFNAEEWIEKFTVAGRPQIERTLQRSAVNHAANTGLAISFDVHTPLVQGWIDDRTLFWADRVNRKTAKQVAQELTDARAQEDEKVETSAHIAPAAETGGYSYPITARAKAMNEKATLKPWVAAALNNLQAGGSHGAH